MRYIILVFCLIGCGLVDISSDQNDMLDKIHDVFNNSNGDTIYYVTKVTNVLLRTSDKNTRIAVVETTMDKQWVIVLLRPTAAPNSSGDEYYLFNVPHKKRITSEMLGLDDAWKILLLSKRKHGQADCVQLTKHDMTTNINLELVWRIVTNK